MNPVCCPVTDCSIWKTFSKRTVTGDLPQVKSLLSLFIMTIKNDHRSWGFIKINDSPEEMHLLTYSSLHAPTVNSQLPVFPAWFLAAESISIRQHFLGFTAQNIFITFHCQFFLYCTICPVHYCYYQSHMSDSVIIISVTFLMFACSWC